MRISLHGLLIWIGLIFCILLISISVFITIDFYQKNNKNDIQLYAKILENVSMSISEKVGEAENALSSFSERPFVKEFAADTPLEKFRKSEMIRNAIDDIVLYIPLITHMRISLVNGQSIQSSVGMSSNSYMDEYLFNNKAIDLLNFGENTGYMVRSKIISIGNSNRYAMAVPIKVNNQQTEGFCIAVCDLKAIENLLPEQLDSAVFQNGEILVTNNLTLFSQLQTIPEENSTDDFQFITSQIPNTNWVVCCAKPSNSMEKIDISMEMIAFIIIGIAALIIGMLLLVYRIIVKPIDSIIYQLEGNPYSGKAVINQHRERNELTRLADGINSLTDRIVKMDAEIIQVNQEKYQIQLNQLTDRILLLQTQMNPHFLYNNLECIRGMALLDKLEEIREMTNSMALIARYSMGGGLSCVDKEIECVRHYFRIICLRYGDKYTMNINIPDNVRSCICPRMILQPIIENSIRHGFVKAKQNGGIIDVNGSYDEHECALILQVDDNGIGIEQSAMVKMNEDFTSVKDNAQQKLQEKVGLYNVNFRLCLLGKGMSGLHIFKSEHGGLCVQAKYILDTSALPFPDNESLEENRNEETFESNTSKRI